MLNTHDNMVVENPKLSFCAQPIKGSKDEGPLFPNRSHPLYPTKMVSYQNYQQFFQHPLNSSSQCLAHTTHDGHRQTIDGVSQNEQQNTKNSHQRYFSASHNQSMVSHDGNRTITPPGFKAPRSADPFETLIAGAPSNQPNDHRGNQFFGVTMLGPSLLVHRNPQMLQRIRHSSGPTGDMSLLTPSSSTSSRSTTNNSTEGMDVTSLLGIPELGFANGNQMTSLYPFHPSRTSLALSSLETMGMASPMAPIIIAKELPIVREMQASKLKVDERRLTLGFFEGITREANSLVSKVTPSSDELQSMEKIVKNLQDSLQTLLPGCVLKHFNSTAVHSHGYDADMEIAVALGNNFVHPIQALDIVSHAAHMIGMQDNQVLAKARIPVVTMREPVTGIPCSVRLESSLHIYVQLLFETYAKIDSRFEDLCYIVKTWFQNRMQRESPQGMIQSSIYIYMVLHLLQVRGVLPCLQQLWKTAQGEPPQVYVANCQVYFFNDLSQLNLYWRCANTETLGELVVSFFKYYSADFPYVHGALSVRMRSIIPKDAKGWTKERQHQMNKAGIKDRYWFCVEHPFDLSYNVAKTMDKETLFKLRGEFIRASKIICGGSFGDGPVLQDILSPQHSTPTSLKFSPTHMNPHFW